MEKPIRREKRPYNAPRVVEYGSLVLLTGGTG